LGFLGQAEAQLVGDLEAGACFLGSGNLREGKSVLRMKLRLFQRWARSRSLVAA
jgi:hypothetical protein